MLISTSNRQRETTSGLRFILQGRMPTSLVEPMFVADEIPVHTLCEIIGYLVEAARETDGFPAKLFIFDSKPIPVCKPIRHASVRLLRKAHTSAKPAVEKRKVMAQSTSQFPQKSPSIRTQILHLRAKKW